MGSGDRLAHAHLKSLYDHVRLVYPAVEAEGVVDLVMSAATPVVESVPRAEWQVWLYRLTRATVHRMHPSDRWRRANAKAVTRLIERSGHAAQGSPARRDVAALVSASQMLPLDDQETLRLVTVEPISNEELGVILDVDESEAAARVERVLQEFRAAYLRARGG